MLAFLLTVTTPSFAQDDVLFVPDEVHVLGDHQSLPEGVGVYAAGTVVNLRAAPGPDGPVVKRLLAGTRVVVVEDIGGWVEVRSGATRGWIARELVSTMGRVTDLDGDGVEERAVVAMGADGVTKAWIREGERVQRQVINQLPSAFLGSWEVVPADRAGVALLRVDLDQDSCGEYPTVWLSFTDDRLQTALEVRPWANGAQGESYEVDFVEPGLVTVRQETYGELDPVVAERACVLEAGVFSCS